MKEHKSRTVVTVLGICVSVAMITAVFVALASFMNLFAETELMSSGNFHAEFDVNAQQLAALKNDDRIEKIGIKILSENDSFQLEDRRTNASGTGDFCSGDKVFVKQMITGSYDGVLPQRIGEIAVEKKLIERNELDWEIGDTVTIPTGRRYYIDKETGDVLDVYGSYYSNEQFDGTPTQYKITAILHDNPATAFQPIIRCNKDEASPFFEGEQVTATINLKNVNHNSVKEIQDIAKTNNILDYDFNNEFFSMHFAVAKDDETVISLISLTAIILAIIIVASVVLIYNAFAMSISERVRYLGMLASVGATKKQKRRSVYFESFLLGIIGIPVGMAAGILGIGITLKAIGGKIISTGMIRGISDANMDMKIVAPLWALAGILLLSVLTIFISSFIPSRKASKITPIDAIRQTNEVKFKAKKLRSPKLVRLIFGYEGELANKNLKRNGRKSRVITASIALSVILFLCCNYYCSLFTQTIGELSTMPYQVLAGVFYDDLDNLKLFLDNLDEVDDYYLATNHQVSIEPNRDVKYDFEKTENLTSAYKNVFSNRISIYMNIIDDEDFNKLCEANGLDANDFYGDEFKALLMNNVSHGHMGGKVFTDKIIGSTFGEDVFGTRMGYVEVGALIDYNEDLKPCQLNPKNTISLYFPISQDIKLKSSVKIADVNSDEKYDHVNCALGIETTKHAEVAERLYDYFSLGEFEYHYVNDVMDEMQVMNTLSFTIQVLVYGFITLISLITVFNIINTISTGVAMRKKEFAMLKSVGTTPKGFNKMIMLESAFYGFKALVFALPISALACFGMYIAVDPGEVIQFCIDWLLYLAVVAVVFVVIGATMLYSIHKLKDDNIVETLKEEIN